MKVLSSTSVQLEWDPIPESFRHGVILKYTIVYRNEYTEKENRSFSPASAVSTIVNGLRQSADYLFWIFAATSKGDSPPSKVMKAKTQGKPEKSKEKLQLYVCLSGKMKRILCFDWLTKRAKRGYLALLRPGGSTLLFSLNGYVQLDRVWLSGS